MVFDGGVSEKTSFFESLRHTELFPRSQSTVEVLSEAKFGTYRKEDRQVTGTKKPQTPQKGKSGETEPAGFRRNGSKNKQQKKNSRQRELLLSAQ